MNSLNEFLMVYNPGKAPHHIGQLTFPPLNYSMVHKDSLYMLEGAHLIVEGSPNFPNPWLAYNLA